MPPAARKLLAPAAWIAGVSAALLAIFPLGFPNYDTIYALVWGRELAHGMGLDYGAALPPTPHPLADLLGLLTTPLGQGAITVTMVIAYASLGLIGYLVYRLGSLWFDRAIGVVAALIVLTRAPFLSNGIRAYVDLPYIALCLGALAIETRRPRAGWPVLAALAAAGLLRPEAWLFSAAYLAWLALALERSPRLAAASARRAQRRGARLAGGARRRGPGCLGAVRPDHRRQRRPTRSPAPATRSRPWIGRPGAVDLVLYGPRRLGEVLQWPGMVGAAGGIVLCLALLRRRAVVGIVAAALALGAFALLAVAGLAIIPRYTMLAAAILAVFAAAGLLGWRLLEPGRRWRAAWQAFAVLVALMFLAWGPNQYDLLSTVHTDLANQGRIERDLGDLATSDAFEPLCLPISVPNHRAVPRLAFDLDVRPSRIVSSSEQAQPRRGYFLAPASPFVIHNFILDPKDPTRFVTAKPGRGFVRVGGNRSWILYRHCG